jgi:hypothetical protein
MNTKNDAVAVETRDELATPVTRRQLGIIGSGKAIAFGIGGMVLSQHLPHQFSDVIIGVSLIVACVEILGAFSIMLLPKK